MYTVRYKINSFVFWSNKFVLYLKSMMPINIWDGARLVRQHYTILSGPVVLHASHLIGLMGRVFANDPGDLGSILGCVIQRLLKWYLIPPCLTLSNIRYVSRVKWRNSGKGVVLSPIPGVVAIEKGAFWSPLTTVANVTYLLYVTYIIIIIVVVIVIIIIIMY